MQKPELEFHPPEGEWRLVSGAEQCGVWEQTLAADESTGDATVIQRYDPGARTAAGAIVHDYWEEVILLGGDLTDLTLQETFSTGNYACRPPGMEHGPYLSESGCSMLVVIRP